MWSELSVRSRATLQCEQATASPIRTVNHQISHSSRQAWSQCSRHRMVNLSGKIRCLQSTSLTRQDQVPLLLHHQDLPRLKDFLMCVPATGEAVISPLTAHHSPVQCLEQEEAAQARSHAQTLEDQTPCLPTVVHHQCLLLPSLLMCSISLLCVTLYLSKTLPVRHTLVAQTHLKEPLSTPPSSHREEVLASCVMVAT